GRPTAPPVTHPVFGERHRCHFDVVGATSVSQRCRYVPEPGPWRPSGMAGQAEEPVADVPGAAVGGGAGEAGEVVRADEADHGPGAEGSEGEGALGGPGGGPQQ